MSKQKNSPSVIEPERQNIYEIDGKVFIAEAEFQEFGTETLSDILLRLMHSDICDREDVM